MIGAGNQDGADNRMFNPTAPCVRMLSAPQKRRRKFHRQLGTRTTGLR